MNAIVRDDTPIIEKDESGAWRVGASQVLVELVVKAFKRGETPAQIAERYDTLLLADVHAVIAYYLRHVDEVDVYLRQREEQAQQMRAKVQARQEPRPGFFKELESRIAQGGSGDASAPE